MTPHCMAKFNLLAFLGKKSQLKKHPNPPKTKHSQQHKAHRSRAKGTGLILVHEDSQEIL